MNILLLNDDRWHPGHVSREGIKPLEQLGYHFDVVSDGAAIQAIDFSQYPVILFVKSDNRTAADESKWGDEAARTRLLRFVQDGGGLLAVHSGTAGYDGLKDMHALLGGLFLAHPPQLPVTVTPKAGHPLTTGVQAFTEPDEHYFLDMADQPADVFLTATSRHGATPAGWTRREGRGKVCVLTPGHNVAVWLNPEFQRLLRNALDWCAEREVQ